MCVIWQEYQNVHYNYLSKYEDIILSFGPLPSDYQRNNSLLTEQQKELGQLLSP